MRERIHFLDGIRGLAALYVVFAHVWGTAWDSNAGRFPSGAMKVFNDWLPSGHWSVVIFIVLSGYFLMPRDARLKSVRTFYWKRARRILPPYYAALALALLLSATLIGTATHTIWDLSIHPTLPQVISHVLLIHTLTGHPAAVNYPLWTIAVEWQIYMLLPLLLVAWRTVGGWTALILMPVTVGVAVLLRHNPYLSSSNVHFLWLFAMGCFCVSVARGESRASAWLKRHAGLMLAVAVILFLAAGVVSGVTGGYFVWRYYRFIDVPLGFATAGLLIYLGERDSPLRRFLSHPIPSKLGEFSYSLYLIHAPLLQLVWQYGVARLPVGDNARFAVLTLTGIPLIVACSFAFFLVFELPFISPKARKAVEADLVKV